MLVRAFQLPNSAYSMIKFRQFKTGRGQIHEVKLRTLLFFAHISCLLIFESWFFGLLQGDCRLLMMFSNFLYLAFLIWILGIALI